MKLVYVALYYLEISHPGDWGRTQRTRGGHVEDRVVSRSIIFPLTGCLLRTSFARILHLSSTRGGQTFQSNSTWYPAFQNGCFESKSRDSSTKNWCKDYNLIVFEVLWFVNVVFIYLYFYLLCDVTGVYCFEISKKIMTLKWIKIFQFC